MSHLFTIPLRVFLLILGGALMALAHPFRIHDFIWENSWMSILVGTSGLLVFLPTSLGHLHARSRFLAAFLGGLAYFSVVCYWIAYALETYGDIPFSISLLALLLLAAYLSLFWGLWGWIAGLDWIKDKTPAAKCLCWASLWTFLEAARQWVFTGFGWGELGFAFSFNQAVSSSAAYWGVHGLTFAWIFTAGLLLHLPEIISDRAIRRQSLLIWTLILSLGFFFWDRAYPPTYPPTSEKEIKVAIVQPNIDQEIKWDPRKAEAHLDLLLKMSQAAVTRNADLVAWPETSFPFSISGNQKELPFSSSIPLIFGGVVKEGHSNRNSALLAIDQNLLQRFDKAHLVPFGEFVPLKDWLPFGKLVANAGDFVPGSPDQALLRLPTSEIQIGPLICYEDIFSRSSVALARKGAQMLLNLTNDAWYGKTSAQAQHASLAQMQVYQTGLPMVRVTNNGLSSFMSVTKRIDVTPFQREIAVEKISIPEKPQETFFVLTYPLMEWIWLFIFAIAFLWKSQTSTKRIFFQKSRRY